MIFQALLAVAQKGVKVRYRIVNLPEREAYAPWCMRLNPTGQLPFMEHGGAIIPDSKAITEYLDKTFGKVHFCLVQNYEYESCI